MKTAHFTAIFFLYVIFSLIFLYDSSADYVKTIFGSAEPYLILWNIDWFSDAMSHGKNIFFSDLLFYPKGVNVSFNGTPYPESLLYFFVKPLIPIGLFYNLCILFKFALAGFTMYMLTIYFTRCRVSSFIAGLLFTFAPFHQYHALGHFHVITIEWLPLFLLFYFKSLQNKKILFMIPAGFFFFLSSIGCWYFMIYITLFVLFHLSFMAYTKELKFSVLKHLAVLGITFIVFTGPFLYPMLTDKSGIAVADEGSKWKLDLLAPFIPPDNTLAGSIIPYFSNKIAGNYLEKKTGYFGLSFILLFFILFRKQKSPVNKTFVFILICFFILSLGPSLNVFGYNGIGTKGHISQIFPFLKFLPFDSLSVPLPFYILQKIPLINGARVPARAVIFSLLFFSLLFAGILANFFSNASSKKKYAVLCAIIILILAEFYAPKKLYCSAVPEINTSLLSEKPQGALVNIPMSYGNDHLYLFELQSLYWQIFHKKPITMGSIPRPPAAALKYYRSHIFFRHFMDLHLLHLLNAESFSPLKAEGFRYICIHQKLLRDEILKYCEGNPDMILNQVLELMTAKCTKIDTNNDLSLWELN